MTDLNGNPEEERHAEFYYKSWLEEAVWKYLSEKVQRLSSLVSPPSIFS